MKAELDAILPGLEWEWVSTSESPSMPTSLQSVMARFEGWCETRQALPARIESQFLGRTMMSHGEILPAIEVGCDRISTLIQTFLNGRDRSRREALLGRAIARVLAHELYHVLAKTRSHSKHGVARASLSAEDLTCERLQFDAQEQRRIASNYP
jgi:hypothetical protein